MRRDGYGPGSTRPALLEAVLVCALCAAAVAGVIDGSRTNCTALIEFGLLSGIAALSAGSLFVRYVIDGCGLLADYARFEFWGARLSVIGYAGLALYALVNAGLDLALPRRDADSLSFPGLLTILGALFVVVLVLQTKERSLEVRSSRSLAQSACDDAFYLKIGLVTLAALGGHLIAPNWWLDTVIDGVFIALVAWQIQRRRDPVALRS